MGTSLPELVTSIVAARKGQNDIAMGNVIGSNLFNIFLILGVSSVITPIPVQATSIVDCLFLIAISAVFYLPARKGKLGRVPGIAMVLVVLLFICVLVTNLSALKWVVVVYAAASGYYLCFGRGKTAKMPHD